MKFYVYRHTNLKNGKSYIGWTSRNIYTRWNEHVYRSKKSKLRFHLAIQKYGTHCWKHDVLETLSSADAAKNVEKIWIKKLSTNMTGYNLTSGGDGGAMHPDVIKRANEKRYGRPTWNSTPVVMIDPITLKPERTFRSIQEAQRIMKLQNIHAVCIKKRNHAGGKFWKFLSASDDSNWINGIADRWLHK